MRKRLVSIYIIGILAFSIFGCANTAEDTSVAKKTCTGTHNTSHAGNVESESEAKSEIHNNETVNASGMTLRDDTARLVTVTRYVSPTYNDIYEEYEYDSENRIIKLTEYLHGEIKHEYGYEYRVVDVE